MGLDVVEIEKCLLIVRKRRGDFLRKTHKHGGDRTQDATHGTLNRTDDRNMRVSKYWDRGLRDYVLDPGLSAQRSVSSGAGPGARPTARSKHVRHGTSRVVPL